MRTLRTAVVFLACIFLITWFSGCSTIQPAIPGSWAPSAAPENYLSHTIRRHGENLIIISRWYTGSGENWQRIAEANPTINPRRIRIGDIVRIPENLLITRERMPVDYLEPSVSREDSQPPPPLPGEEPEPAPSEQLPSLAEIELFGPIDTPVEQETQAGSGSDLPLETIE